METSQEVTVKDMVTADYRTAFIFERYAIDFCCGGKKTLDAACAEAGVDPRAVRQYLAMLSLGTILQPEQFGDWPVDALVEHIVQKHHAYVRRMSPVLIAHTTKIASVHGKNHPELNAIASHVAFVTEELTRHMQKEELLLFPYMRSLAAADREHRTIAPPPFVSIRNPIRMMEQEHVVAGDAFKYVRGASLGYTVPDDGCTTYRVTYSELDEFERDLHQHVHLENNILFPKAIDLEEKLTRKE